MSFWRRIAVLTLVPILWACETVPKESQTRLSELEGSPDIIQFDLPSTPYGRMVVDAVLPNGRTVSLLLDTGATRSALYAREWNRLDRTQSRQEIIRIHGMVANDMQPVMTLDSLTIGNKTLRNVPVAKLNNPDSEVLKKEIHDGVLGMDILSQFHLFIDRPNNVLWLIPTALGPVQLPTNWRIVDLKSNPFLEDGRQLHFLDIRLGNALTPALLDTGSEFNLMNWNTKRFPQLRAVKRRLRNKWEIEGAIGTFAPVSKIKVTGYRAGQKYFDDSEFVVLDFESLNVLGIEGRPFVIFGADALKTETYFVDFDNNRLVFAPVREEKIYKSRAAMPTFSNRLRK